MAKRTLGFLLIIIGVVIAVISLSADFIGIGNQQGIGWQQLLGTAIGVIALLVGIWMTLRKPIQNK